MTGGRSKTCTRRTGRIATTRRSVRHAVTARRRIDDLPPAFREVIAVMVQIMLRERRHVRAAGASPGTSPELRDGS